MQTTTRNNVIADYYVYNREGVLQRRDPSRQEVDRLIAKNWGWYARTVVFSDEPVIRAAECPCCKQPYVTQEQTR